MKAAVVVALMVLACAAVRAQDEPLEDWHEGAEEEADEVAETEEIALADV